MNLIHGVGLAYCAMLIFSTSLVSSTLTLESFLSQVHGNHDGSKSAELSSESAKKKVLQSDLPLAWVLNSSVEQRNDYQTPLSLFFLQNTSTTYSLGISKLTTFGLQAKWALNARLYNYVNLPAAYAAIIPFSSYWDISTGVELTQSLWRNGFGGATRIQQGLDEAVALSSYHRNAFTVLELRAQAEVAYWNVASSQQIVKIQQENLERATQLVAWSKKRAKFDLADNSDLLQAESSYELRQLDLIQSQTLEG